MQQCCVASCTVIWRVLPPCCKLQQHVARNKTHFYFVQHVAATCNRVVIRTILRCNLQRNIVARQVARKCCPYYFTLNSRCHFFDSRNGTSILLKRTSFSSVPERESHTYTCYILLLLICLFVCLLIFCHTTLKEFLRDSNAADSCTAQHLGLLLLYHLQVNTERLYHDLVLSMR